MRFVRRPSGSEIFRCWAEARHTHFRLEELDDVLEELEMILLDQPDILTVGFHDLD
jgi:hypothetical protein